MKKQNNKDQHKAMVELYWKTLDLPQKLQALRDQYGIDMKMPHTITFQDKEVAFLTGP